MQNRVINTPNIELIYHSETVDILGKDTVESVIIKNVQSNEQRTLKVTGFFVAIGHKPNTDIFKGQIDMDELGYIDVIAGSTKTKLKGVFAVGDCADKTYRQAVTAAGSGCMGALDAERYLANEGIH
jgi:thioredoxin reductase (NADPH)